MTRNLATLASRAASLAHSIGRDLRDDVLVEMPQPADDLSASDIAVARLADLDLSSILNFVA